MFDTQQFIADCRAALQGDRAAFNVRAIVAGAVSDPPAVVKEFGEPGRGGIHTIHRSPELTIINVLWPVGQIVMPHDHALWAVIGVYAGREDNIVWRRLPGESDGRIKAVGALSLGEKDTMAFGSDVIHSVVNPVSRVTAAIHVYGGDFFSVPRSEWDPDSLRERPYDLQKVLRMFEK